MQTNLIAPELPSQHYAPMDRIRPDARQSDQRLAWEMATNGTPPTIQFMIGKACFPGCVKPSQALMCQVYFTNVGLFVIGMAELDLTVARPGGGAVAAVTLAGGLLAGWNAANQQEQKRTETLNKMYSTYQATMDKFANASLATRFLQSEWDVYHFSHQEIQEILPAQKPTDPIRIVTTFGTLELPVPLSEEIFPDLNAWANCLPGMKAASPGQSAWTWQKAIIHLRSIDTLEAPGLREYLKDAAQFPLRVQPLCKGLAKGLDNDKFWRMMNRMDAYAGSNSAFAREAATAKRKTVTPDIVWGLLLSIGGLGLVGLILIAFLTSPHTSSSTSRDDPGPGGILLFVLICGLCGLIGIYRLHSGFTNLSRSNAYLRK